MPDTVLVAVLSLIGTMAGSFSGTQMIKYRIEQLEKKGGKTQFCDRTHIFIRRKNKSGESQNRRFRKEGEITWNR